MTLLRWIKQGNLECLDKSCFPIVFIAFPLRIYVLSFLRILVVGEPREEGKPQPDLTSFAVNQLMEGTIHKQHGTKGSYIEEFQHHQLQLAEKRV